MDSITLQIREFMLKPTNFEMYMLVKVSGRGLVVRGRGWWRTIEHEKIDDEN